MGIVYLFVSYMVSVFHIGVGYRRCSFNHIGQCESLYTWDE